MNGLFNEMTYFNGVPETVADILKHYDDLGGPNSYPHYAAGWAVAGTRRLRGRSRSPAPTAAVATLVVHWPKGIKAKGEVRSQWHHVIDIAPTVLEGRVARTQVGERRPADAHRGVSMVYSFNDAKAKDTRKTQYFEIFGNRGIYHDGWLAHTVHRAAGKANRGIRSWRTWHLYHVDEDFSSANDLAAKNPEKLKALQELFLKEAAKNHALPLDDRSIERMNATLVGRPELMAGRNSLTVYDGMIGMTENVFINTKNRSHTITAEVAIPKGGANGVIWSQAGGSAVEPVRQGGQADVHLQLPRPQFLQGRFTQRSLKAR